MYPEDPRAPFYDPNQHEMQPLARFHFQREKLIPKSCDFDFLQMQLSEIESTSDVEEDKRRNHFLSLLLLLLTIFPFFKKSGMQSQRIFRLESLFCILW